ncbi:MAG: hypothetical protein WA896_03265 [Spirulinaceae cyanobacterium]
MVDVFSFQSTFARHLYKIFITDHKKQSQNPETLAGYGARQPQKQKSLKAAGRADFRDFPLNSHSDTYPAAQNRVITEAIFQNRSPFLPELSLKLLTVSQIPNPLPILIGIKKKSMR